VHPEHLLKCVGGVCLKREGREFGLLVLLSVSCCARRLDVRAHPLQIFEPQGVSFGNDADADAGDADDADAGDADDADGRSSGCGC